MNTLPEACIAKILSLTTPLDVCRLSAVSKIFSSAADSDDVWNHFLPTDFPEGIVAPSAVTRKQLFFSLVNHPLLLHDSKLSFWLDIRSGNKCYMLAARSLNIAWGNDQRYWKWISVPNTRFREVAELISVCWFDITGKINITLLSDDTLYVAYLVFKLKQGTHGPFGFTQPKTASVFLVDIHTVDVQPSMVSLMQNPGNGEDQCAELRRDSWFEVKLGQFFKSKGDSGDLEMNLRETKRLYEKRCLIVLGIEIRPMP